MKNIPGANNAAVVSGIVRELPKFSHTVFDEDFYAFALHVSRKSGAEDVIRIILPEKAYAAKNISAQDVLLIHGQYRSRNTVVNGKNHLSLFVFASHAELLIENAPEHINDVFLRGFICKPIVYRKTPGGREIADILLAVNRRSGKSDYIPCIAWGRNALFSSKLIVGTQIEVRGRIQSRTYLKKDGDEERLRMASEVSVAQLSLAD